MKNQTTKPDEALLLGKLFAGDDDAFHSLFSLYNRKLTVFGLKMLSSRAAAEDLAQDVWIRVIEQRKNPKPVEHVGAYLFRIARNLCLDRLRAKRDHTSIDELPEDLHPAAETDERTELEEIVLAALDRLSEDDREVLVLHSYLGYGYDEIAEMQEKRPEAVWTRASRARAKLREIVQSEARSAGIPIPDIRGSLKQTTA